MQTSNTLLSDRTEGKSYFLFLITFLFLTNGSFTNIFSQTFVKVTDPTNPVTTTATDGNYAGSAWIDIDNDGKLDLHVTKNFLFRNIGGGNFERLNDFTSVSSNQLGNGTSWGDYDNDGDIDLFLSGNPSIVYQNNGTVDATEKNPSFTYSSNGTYSVSLTVSNGTDNETKTRTDYIIVNGVTGIEDLNGQIPNEFGLFQNYPNPFNPSTSIKFSVASESQVVIKVYNLLGIEVATLMNEKKTPGFYELNFGGEKLTSGIYVYRLEAGSFSSSKKMMLIK